jgi:hypothetical protein
MKTKRSAAKRFKVTASGKTAGDGPAGEEERPGAGD